MIVDFHVHINSPELIGQGYWDSWVKLASALTGRPEESIRGRLPEFWDEGGEMLISDMDSAGITYSVISALDFGLTKGIGEASYNILEINRLYSTLQRKYPNRFIPFTSVDPRRDNAMEILKICISDFGMKGIKLLPPSGFYPNDRICYPIYELACDNELPVLVHTGPEGLPLYSKYGYPIFMDEVASDFPDMKIILGHAGFCWWPEALGIASNKPNIYLDLAGWQTRVRRLPIEEFYKPLRVMLNNIGSSRILFGSDWPALRLLMSSKRWVDVFKNPPQVVKEMEMMPSETEVGDILGGSAARLLKIKS
jgi:hypothetical protein